MKRGTERPGDKTTEGRRKSIPLRRPILLVLWVMAIIFAVPGLAQDHNSVELRLHFSKGDTHRMNLTLDQTVQQTVQGKPQETKQIVGVTYTFTVDGVDDHGVAKLSVHYDAVSFHAKSPAGAVDYDSSQPPGMVPPVASGLAALVGQGYALQVSPDGKVTEVSGIETLLNSVLGKLNIPEGPARAAAEKGLRQQINEQNIRSNLQSIFAQFPDAPVAPGQSWTRKSQVSLGFPLLIQTTYTLRGEQNGTATVDLVGNSSTAPNATVDLGQMKMTYDMHGSMKGSFDVQESSGWIVESHAEQSLTGNATIRVPGSPAQIVPIAVRTVMTTRQQ